ncbi:MAG: hypothetical protein KBT20_01135 [Bacteroidales bacterium]|nr:hypothetical protein [Candidatus Liminaster caballi]
MKKNFTRFCAALVGMLMISVLPLSAQMDVKVTVIKGVDNPAVKQTIEQQAGNVLSAFNAAVMEGKKLKDKLKERQVPKEMESTLLNMWQSSAIACAVSEIKGEILKLPTGGYQLRDIPVSMLASDDDDQDLVFNFDENGILNNVYVALELHNYKNVIVTGVSVEDFTRRQIILDFVENFRTAYNRKDLDYLRQVYSNDALIITGKVLQKKPQQNDYMNQSLGAVKVQQTVMNKEQYMKNLQRVFGKNSYINLKFEEVSVKRHPKHERIYGVTLKQYWNSSTYSDVGYLFLMINFEDETNPSIEVRTWQPDKFDDGTPIPRDEVFSLDDFNI